MREAPGREEILAVLYMGAKCRLAQLLQCPEVVGEVFERAGPAVLAELPQIGLLLIEAPGGEKRQHGSELFQNGGGSALHISHSAIRSYSVKPAGEGPSGPRGMRAWDRLWSSLRMYARK